MGEVFGQLGLRMEPCEIPSRPALTGPSMAKSV
jgi:hypothetical protein